MKIVILVLCLLFPLLSHASTHLRKVTLDEFASLISSDGYSMVLHGDVDPTVSFYLTPSADKITALRLALATTPYELQKHSGIYYVAPRPVVVEEEEKEKTLTFYAPDLSQKLLEELRSSYSSVLYNPLNGVLLVSGFPSSLLSLESFLKSQVSINTYKVTVMTIKDGIEDRKGFNLALSSSLEKENISAFLSLLSLGGTVQNLSRFNLSAVVDFLRQQEDVAILTEPILYAKDGIVVSSSVVKTVPVVTSTTTLNGQLGTSTTQEDIEYRDVGISVSLRSITHSGYSTVALDLAVEDIVSNVSGRLITDKKTLKTVVDVREGEVYLISGLSTVTDLSTRLAVPFISNLPLVGDVFTHTSTSVEKYNIYIILQKI